MDVSQGANTEPKPASRDESSTPGGGGGNPFKRFLKILGLGRSTRSASRLPN